MPYSQRHVIRVAGKLPLSHDEFIRGSEKHLDVIIAATQVRFTDARGVMAFKHAVKDAHDRGRTIRLPIISPNPPEQDMSQLSRLAIGSNPSMNVSSPPRQIVKVPEVHIEVGGLVLICLDMTAIESLLRIAQRAERMSTELPGGFRPPNSEAHKRLRTYARTRRKVELPDDPFVLNSIIALSRGDEVPWLDHLQRNDPPLANTYREIARGYAKHAATLAKTDQLMGESELPGGGGVPRGLVP